MSGRRGVLLRSLPVLLFLLLALAGAPRAATPAPPVAASASAATASSPAPADPVARQASSSAEPPVDRAAVLRSQITAGVRGCRAPPAASV